MSGSTHVPRSLHHLYPTAFHLKSASVDQQLRHSTYSRPNAPSSSRRIPDGSLPAALPSTRNLPRRAVRQGAAWPTERPSGHLVVLQVVSRRQVPHRRRTLVVAGRPGAVHRSTVRRPSVQSGGRGGPGCLSSAVVPRWPVQVLGRVHADTRPVSGVRVTVRCPRRCPTHPLSNARVWTSRCPGVGCPRSRLSTTAEN